MKPSRIMSTAKRQSIILRRRRTRPGGRQPQESTPSGTFVPVLFLPWDKPDVSDSLLVCFGALALSQVTGILADTGTLIYGDGTAEKP